MDNVPRPDPSRDTKEALQKIRRHLSVSLSYLENENDRRTLAILNGHIEDQLKEIERHTGLPVTPYQERDA